MHSAPASAPPAPAEALIGEPDAFVERRAAMVANQLRTNEVIEPALVRALLATPRERFVPAALMAAAYTDRALPLGDGRALNPALTTARLIADARVAAGQRILLIGAATGYAAALITTLGAAVVAVEESEALSGIARDALADTHDVTFVTAPLVAGAPEAAPFDALIIDGAVDAVPAALTTQLRPGARIACGIVDRGVTRLARAVVPASAQTKAAALRVVAYADLECVVLPGFAAPPQFRF